MLLIHITLYYIFMLKLLKLRYVSLLCYVLVMMKCVIDWMLRYMLLRCAIEIVPCALVDENMCYLNWGMNWSGWIVSMHGSKLWKMIVMRLSWDDDQMKLWWNVKIWIKVKDQLFSSSLLIKFWWNWNEGNPKRAGTPACEKVYEAGTPASGKENGQGLLQLRKIMRQGLPQEKEKNGRDSRKRKRNVYDGDSHKWMMIWWGLPQEKGWDSSNVRGCEFDKQIWRGEKLASHNQRYIWMDSMKFGLLVESWKIV